MVDPQRLKIVWLAPSYGYRGDLMYYAALFADYLKAFPQTRVAVTRDFAVERYPALALWPVLKFWHFKLRRMRNGIAYIADLSVPSPGIFRHLVSFAPDLLVLTEFTPVALIGWVYAKLWRKKLLLLIESDPAFRSAPDHAAIRAVKRFIARHVDLVMTNNTVGEAYLLRLGLDAQRIFTAPYLTSDAGQSDAIETEPPVALRRAEDKINVLFLNSIEERKGVSEMVDAFLHLDTAMREAFLFHIVGDGSKRAEIEAMIAAAGVSNSFVFYGRVPFAESWRYYEAADLVISPTLADYRSLTGFEALACGKPLLLSKLDGACGEVIAEGRNGFSFDPRDSAEFAQRLSWFAAHREQLADFAAESRRLAQSFSRTAVADNLKQATLRAVRALS